MSKTYGGYPPKDAYGNIDPEWANEQCHKHDLEQYVADQKYIREQLKEEKDDNDDDDDNGTSVHVTCNISGNFNDDDEEDDDYDEYENSKAAERGELDARFEFLKAHSGNPEDLKLAKEILKIRD